MKECVLLSQQDLAHGKRSTWTGVDGCGSTDPSTHSARKTTSRTLAARYADSEGEGEQTLTSNEHRELIGVSSDDPTWEIRYPAYWGPADEETVSSALGEITVKTGSVQIYPYPDPGRERLERTAYPQGQALRGNKQFVPFDRIVLDEVTNNITTQYIPGGTLEHYRCTFYFRWLKQLTDAVDELNLHYGLMHRDLAPRNILIDPASQGLLVFDFDRSGQIGGRGKTKTQNGGATTLMYFDIYYLRDSDAGRKFPRGAAALGTRGERRSAKKIRHFSEASEPIAWPEYGKLEMREVPKDEYGVCMSFRRKRKHVEGAGG
ncbi:hypothetical protein H101_01060 [Trichophyton interdigitale H6]|nr:hypothetical protein H101_01060 [Trichophyton interdigitale H6]